MGRGRCGLSLSLACLWSGCLVAPWGWAPGRARESASECVVAHACRHLRMSVGAHVGMSVSLERLGRCVHLGVTAVTKELQRAERRCGPAAAAAPGGGGRGLLPEEGSWVQITVWSQAAARGLREGLRPRCSPAAALPGRIRALPTPASIPGALREGAGGRRWGWGPTARAPTPAGAPHPADNGRREQTARLGPGGRGSFPEGRQGH